MRWLSCHFGTLRHNEQTKVGTWNKFGRLVIQIKNNIWVIESSQRHPPSPIIDTPQKVTKMIVLPLLFIPSLDASALNAFLERWKTERVGLFCCFWPSAPPSSPLAPPTYDHSANPGRHCTKPTTGYCRSSSPPSLATTPSLKNTCMNIWTDEL